MSFPFCCVNPVSAAAAMKDSPSPIAVDQALITLVRLLARQAVRDWLSQPGMTEDNGDTGPPSLSSAISAGERP
jgi:hypothetical protein